MVLLPLPVVVAAGVGVVGGVLVRVVFWGVGLREGGIGYGYGMTMMMVMMMMIMMMMMTMMI